MYLLLWLCVGGLVFHLVPMLPARWGVGLAIESNPVLQFAAVLVVFPYALIYCSALWSLKFLRGGK